MPDLTLPRVPPVLWCAIALLLCLSAVAARVIWRAEPLLDSLQPTRVPVTAADRAHALQRLGPFEDVQFTTADGVTLRGWYKPARNGAAVIFVHGGGNNRLWFLPEAAALVRSGFGVLLFDSRANGESAGALQSWGDHEPADARAALADQATVVNNECNGYTETLNNETLVATAVFLDGPPALTSLLPPGCTDIRLVTLTFTGQTDPTFKILTNYVAVRCGNVVSAVSIQGLADANGENSALFSELNTNAVPPMVARAAQTPFTPD